MFTVNYTASTDSTISEQPLSLRRPRFDTSHFVWDLWGDKVTLGYVFSEYFDFPMSVSFHPMFHIESFINLCMNHSSIHLTIHSAQTLHILSNRQYRQIIHFPGCYEKNYDKPQSGYLISEDIGTQNLRKAKYNTNW